MPKKRPDPEDHQLFAGEGMNPSLTAAKFRHLTSTIQTLSELADEMGYDDIGEWVMSEEFDPELLEEHGAKYRRGVGKHKNMHNYEWVEDMSSSMYDREYRVGITLIIPKGKGKHIRANFTAREFYRRKD